MMHGDGWQEPELGAWAKGRVQKAGAATGRLPWLETTIRRWIPGGLGNELTEKTLPGKSLATRSAGHLRGPVPTGLRLSAPDSLSTLTHDVRNMMAALDLYCDLLEEPGVLEPTFLHYASELRLVSGACRNLMQRLGSMEALTSPAPAAGATPAGKDGWIMGEATPAGVEFLARRNRNRMMAAAEPVRDLAEELLANKNLLSALAGPGITLGMHFDGGARPIALAGEDLTRIMVNLVKNASEAMPSGGHIQIGLEERAETMLLTVSDSGCGLSEDSLEAVFSPGYSTRVGLEPEESAWPARHQGLGLAIVRSLVTAAAGSVWASNLAASPAANTARETRSGIRLAATGQPEEVIGAVFTMEFPLRR
jgi:signal transduction histidine kinase